MRKPSSRAAILLVLAALLAGGCGGSPSGIVPAGRRTDVAVANFGEVVPGIFRGAQPDEAGFAALAAMGVKTIVSFRDRHRDDKGAAPHGFSLVSIPMKARISVTPPDDDEIRTFLAAVTDPAKQPVFFHCAQGKDRTGAMCAVYRMEVQGWTAQAAYDEMHAYGWHDEAYPELGAFVRAYKPHVLAAAAPR